MIRFANHIWMNYFKFVADCIAPNGLYVVKCKKLLAEFILLHNHNNLI